MRHHHLRLRTLLPALAGAALAACGGGISPLADEGASSGSSGSPGGSSGSSGTGSSSGSSGTTREFDLDVCTGTAHRLLEGVTQGDGVPRSGGRVEYMELREEYDPGGQPRVVAQQGTPCASV